MRLLIERDAWWSLRVVGSENHFSNEMALVVYVSFGFQWFHIALSQYLLITSQ